MSVTGKKDDKHLKQTSDIMLKSFKLPLQQLKSLMAKCKVFLSSRCGEKPEYQKKTQHLWSVPFPTPGIKPGPLMLKEYCQSPSCNTPSVANATWSNMTTINAKSLAKERIPNLWFSPISIYWTISKLGSSITQNNILLPLCPWFRNNNYSITTALVWFLSAFCRIHLAV